MRTGNHTSAPQWLYILWNVPYIWLIKVGVGGKLKKRTQQVGKSAPGLDFPVFVTWVIGAYQLEQAIHRICARLQPELGPHWGTGRTERFYLPALIPALALALAWTLLCWGSVGLLVYAIIKQI